jgi:predicted DNA-binding transcriptional regulator AlpA
MTDQIPSRLRARETAFYLRLSRSTLAKWRMRGEGPAFHRFGPKLVYYLKHELDQWLADCDERHPGKAGGDRNA